MRNENGEGENGEIDDLINPETIYHKGNEYFGWITQIRTKSLRETLANGVPVTVLRGNKICRIEPYGNTTIVASVTQSKFKVSLKTFKLQ